ncbi:Anti-anti-sigma regulatory factor (antagonist of anti-sigma factor), partial [Mycobacterium numidiamassiliense]
VSADVAEPFTTRVTLSAALIAELGAPRSGLKAIAQRSDSAVIINAAGEVDAFNEDIWRQLIGEAAAAAEPPGALVIDVNDFDFLGCCAFHVLADEARRCRERGVAVRLVSRSPTVARYVAACGFDGILPVLPTAVAALYPLARP